MKKKVFIAGVMMVFVLFVISLQVDAEDLLQGDEKDACEALLCLSSGKRPSECEPSVRKYFSLRGRTARGTLRKRKNFLEMCPATKEDKQTGTLADAIVNGAGMCDSASLNRRLKKRRNLGEGRWMLAIGDRMPRHCLNYYNHEYTNLNDDFPKYVGIPERGGFWIEPSGYETALAKYNRRIQEEDERERRRLERLEAGGD